MQTLSVTHDKTSKPGLISEGKHVVAQYDGREGAPTLLVFGSIHGNELSGVIAMKNVAKELADMPENIVGNLYFIAGNTRAINKNIRFIDSDLNRHWTPENVKKNLAGSETESIGAEDLEQREILEIIGKALSNAENEVFSIDLHSTSSESTPFAMIGDTIRNRTFAQKFPATFLLGIEEQLDGTIMEYMNDLGSVTLGFEAGQHTTAAAVTNQEALIWLSMLNAGIVKPECVSPVHYENMERAMGRPQIIEIRYRKAITAEDAFEMKPGYVNFQPVRKGEVLAHDSDGEVKAFEGGMILMPLYQKLGSDGFFLGRRVAPFWLKVSRLMRRLKVGNLMKWLPGVRQQPDNPDAFVVNTRIARILPLQVFHLLGFRRMRWENEKLVVTRRKHDTKSPFVKK